MWHLPGLLTMLRSIPRSSGIALKDRAEVEAGAMAVEKEAAAEGVVAKDMAGRTALQLQAMPRLPRRREVVRVARLRVRTHERPTTPGSSSRTPREDPLDLSGCQRLQALLQPTFGIFRSALVPECAHCPDPRSQPDLCQLLTGFGPDTKAN